MAETTGRLHLKPRHRAVIEGLLKKHLPGVEVWAYGSRVNGRSHDGSDLDLVLRARKLKEIPIGPLDELWDALRESTIPFLVEARDWARLPESFHREIERDYVMLVAPWTERKSTKADAGIVRIKPENLRRKKDKWQVLSFRDAGISVIDCEHRTPPPVEKGYPYVAIPQIKDGRIDIHGARRIKLEHFKEWTRKAAPEPHDVVLSRRCNPGETGYVSEKIQFALGQNLVLLRSDQTKVFKPFLRWLVRGPQWWEQVGSYLNVGAVFDSLKCVDIPSLHLSIPPQAEQRSIAHILGTLDDKIELNRRMNETLEAMAQSLFKSWFLDFDPVRAKMEGRNTGLPKPIANLFPNRFTESELGLIPEGWDFGTLGDIAALNPESWNARNPPEDIVYVDLSNTKWGQIEKIDRYPWKKAPSRARRVLRPGDTIVGTVRPGNGSFALIGRDGLTGSTGFAVLRPKAADDREIVWCAATSRDNIDRLAHLADGGAYPAVRPHAVAGTPVALADFPVKRAFSAMVAPWLDRIEYNRRESRKLASLRNTLLPVLVSGELRMGPSHT